MCTAVAMTCPRYSCVPLYLDTCLNVSQSDITLAKCRPSFECPPVSLSNLTTQHCVPSLNTTSPLSFPCLPRGQPGAPCSLYQPCSPGLYCNSSNACQTEAALAAPCTHLHECGLSSVCNSGTCVPVYSLPTGALSDSRVACSSALVFNGTCLAPVYSRDPLPVMCNSDEDCIGSDFTSKTRCECGVNRMGFAYCNLHPSDRPVLKFLKAIHNGDLEEAAEMRYWVVNYPKLVDSLDCFESTIEELRKKEVLDTWEDFCGGEALVAAGIAVLFGS